MKKKNLLLLLLHHTVLSISLSLSLSLSLSCSFVSAILHIHARIACTETNSNSLYLFISTLPLLPSCIRALYIPFDWAYTYNIIHVYEKLHIQSGKYICIYTCMLVAVSTSDAIFLHSSLSVFIFLFLFLVYLNFYFILLNMYPHFTYIRDEVIFNFQGGLHSMQIYAFFIYVDILILICKFILDKLIWL